MSVEPLKFETSTGDLIEVPYLADAFTFKQLRTIRKKATVGGELDGEVFQDLLIDALPKETKDTIENLSVRDFTAFIEQWNEVDEMGESSSS